MPNNRKVSAILDNTIMIIAVIITCVMLLSMYDNYKRALADPVKIELQISIDKLDHLQDSLLVVYKEL